MKFYIIVEGTPMDGFRYVGPFKSHDAAECYAHISTTSHWWVAEIDAPVKTTITEDVS